MERFLREAIMKYLTEGVLDETVLNTSDKREAFKKNLRNMKMEGGTLLYKGRRNDWLPIPTPEQVDNLLYKVHVKGVKAGEVELEENITVGCSCMWRPYRRPDGHFRSASEG